MLVAIVSGNVGKDAEIHSTPKGSVCNFSVAARSGKEGEPTWLRCAVWGVRGEKLAPHIKKGGRVSVTGELRLSVADGKLRADLSVDHLDFGSPRAPATVPLRDALPATDAEDWSGF